MNQLILWFAQGFGTGRIPAGPGTWGSLVGLLWFALLLQSPFFFIIGIVLSIPLSVGVCTAGEQILKQKDPGSIVFDEIIAIPICFVGWLGIVYFNRGIWPSVEYFFTAPHWQMTAAVFVLFRCFDIAKPWPVKQSQNLPRGWGVTADDVLAALYVNVVVVIAWWIKPEWFVA